MIKIIRSSLIDLLLTLGRKPWNQSTSVSHFDITLGHLVADVEGVRVEKMKNSQSGNAFESENKSIMLAGGVMAGLAGGLGETINSQTVFIASFNIVARGPELWAIASGSCFTGGDGDGINYLPFLVSESRSVEIGLRGFEESDFGPIKKRKFRLFGGENLVFGISFAH